MAQINKGSAANDGTGTSLRAAADILNATGLRKNNYAATAAPTTAADSAAGYEPGSLWLNTSNGNLYGCTSATAGAAVWSLLYPQPGTGGGTPPGNYAATVDPTTANGNPTYSRGSMWINIVDDRVWICLDAPVSGAALWHRLETTISAVGLTAISAIADTDRVVVERADGSPASAPAAGVVRGDGTVLQARVMTAAAYAALTPKVSTTLYIIVG